MTMTIALDMHDRIVSIQDVSRGLACMCRCIECGEPVVARKGNKLVHHFAHASQKIPCEVKPESFVHRYAKQVLMENLGLQLPPMPGHYPDTLDQSSWWDFGSVKEEVWLGDFRPDLVAELKDGPLLIEIACTSFVGDEKQARIEKLGMRTIEIDLSSLEVTPSPEGLLELQRAILHDPDLKQWLYPIAEEPTLAERLNIASAEIAAEEEQRVGLSERVRYTIQGLWVDMRVLKFGAVVVRSVSYSPAIAELLKRLAWQYGGHYVAKYRNWRFLSCVKDSLQRELEALADSEPSICAPVVSVLPSLSQSRTDNPHALSPCLNARVVLEQYQQGYAPGCLPVGEFRARHYGADLDCDALEAYFRASGIELLGIEVIRAAGQVDFAYKLRR